MNTTMIEMAQSLIDLGLFKASDLNLYSDTHIRDLYFKIMFGASSLSVWKNKQSVSIISTIN